MQDEVNTKVVAIMIKGGKISAEVLKKALDKFVQEIEKAQKQMERHFVGIELNPAYTELAYKRIGGEI